MTKRICLSLQRRDRDMVLHARESGTIIRTAHGGYFERHDGIDEFERWPLVQHEAVAPLELPAGTDANGVASPTARSERLRARLSHFYFKDAVNPVTPAELAAAHPGPHEEEVPALEHDADHFVGIEQDHADGVGAPRH